jgi:hypothetical protein
MNNWKNHAYTSNSQPEEDSGLSWVWNNVFYGRVDALPHEVVAFPFIWGQFERKYLASNASYNRVEQLVNQLDYNDVLPELERTWRYFKNRYAPKGKTTAKFSDLWTREQGKDLVAVALENPHSSEDEVVKAVIIIAWRFRNHYFHGVKQFIDMEEQNRNFSEVNRALVALLNCQKR